MAEDVKPVPDEMVVMQKSSTKISVPKRLVPQWEQDGFKVVAEPKN